MSRSGYTDDIDDNWRFIMWRGAVASAIRGKRGQAFLREALAALDALPEPKLITEALELDGAVCAIGAVGKARALDMSAIDPEASEAVAKLFGISEALVKEIAYVNDEWMMWHTPEDRFTRVRKWIADQLIK